MQHNVWTKRLRTRAPKYKQKQRTRTLRTKQETVPNQVTDSETWSTRLRARAPGHKQQNIDSKKRTGTLKSKKENFPNVTDSETVSIWSTRLRARAPGSKIKSLVLTKRSKILEPKSALNVDQSKQFDEHEKTLREIFDKVPVVDKNKLSDRDGQEEFRAKYQQQHNDWGQSPELKSALIRQRTIDPDNIFGKALPLNIEEIFGYSPFPRSSSASWSSDALLEEEELEYKELMGYIEF